jgi:hypothetical protein
MSELKGNLTSYILDAIKSFIADPPDTQFQRGYLLALISIHNEALELDPNDPLIQDASNLLKLPPERSR